MTGVTGGSADQGQSHNDHGQPGCGPFLLVQTLPVPAPSTEAEGEDSLYRIPRAAGESG